MFITIIIFVITLLILIVSHEFGHFIAAKKLGIKVLEFGFGLPPKIIGKKWGETLVSLNWLPIGGFVKLLGEDEVDKNVLDDKRSFAAKPVLSRIIVVVAGVTMNLLLAIIIFWIILISQGFKEKIPLLIPYHFFGVNQVDENLVLVGNVLPGSPADQAGIKAGDRVDLINGQKVNDADQLIQVTHEQAGKKIKLTLTREDNQKKEVEVTPRQNPPQGQGPLGVELGALTMANLDYHTFAQRLFSGPVHSYNLTSYSISILGNLISTSIQTKDLGPVSQSVAGPVGITKMTGAILQTKAPLIPYLNFIALLSLNLAIINILPFPALDGGRLFFLLIEAVFRKKVKAEIERLIHTVGMAILIALIILITFSDIKKLF